MKQREISEIRKGILRWKECGSREPQQKFAVDKGKVVACPGFWAE